DALLVTHAPSGLEAEMDTLILERLSALELKGALDARGNILARVAGRSAGPATMVAAHKDELTVMVRKIDSDGRIWVEAMGGCRAWKYGEGPFDILSRRGVVPGVLCMGSTHSSELSGRTHAAVRKLPSWDVVYVDCRMDGASLKAAGVGVGDRGVVARSRKTPVYLGEDTVCGYALDDKAAVAATLLLAAALVEHPPEHDVILAFTTCEEPGCSGIQYAARAQEFEDLIAVEIAPMAEEYAVVFDSRPVLMHKDGVFHYSLSLSHALEAAALRVGTECQGQVVRSFGSDAGMAMKNGLAARAACIAFPTYNTHGYEMAHLGAIENCTHVLTEHLCRPPSGLST
ncbi:MAG: M20/M25/M40 family metallo-hydrolase, partial [Lentisphaeria bacterium]|nr:M20/M25/M40 family metallo-hydrolase [Lentisphaeria bacterium]